MGTNTLIPRDLIATARRTVGTGPGAPRQSDLRRAVSTAYCALFHCLARSSADTLVGKTRHIEGNRRGGRPTGHWSMDTRARSAPGRPSGPSRRRFRTSRSPSPTCSENATGRTTIPKRRTDAGGRRMSRRTSTPRKTPSVRFEASPVRGPACVCGLRAAQESEPLTADPRHTGPTTSRRLHDGKFRTGPRSRASGRAASGGTSRRASSPSGRRRSARRSKTPVSTAARLTGSR